MKGMLDNWKDKYGIPVPIGVAGMFTEFLGSFALLVGFLTRPFALGLAIFMCGGDAEGSLGVWIFFGAPSGRGQRDRVLLGAFSDVDGFAHWRGRRALHRWTAEPLKRNCSSETLAAMQRRNPASPVIKRSESSHSFAQKVYIRKTGFFAVVDKLYEK